MLRRQIIKQSLAKKFGRNISYFKDCVFLSESILNHTGERVSAITLYRYLVISPPAKQPRQYTLDLLCEYAGIDLFVGGTNLLQENDLSIFIGKTLDIYSYNFLCLVSNDRILRYCSDAFLAFFNKSGIDVINKMTIDQLLEKHLDQFNEILDRSFSRKPDQFILKSTRLNRKKLKYLRISICPVPNFFREGAFYGEGAFYVTYIVDRAKVFNLD